MIRAAEQTDLPLRHPPARRPAAPPARWPAVLPVMQDSIKICTGVDQHIYEYACLSALYPLFVHLCWCSRAQLHSSVCL